MRLQAERRTAVNTRPCSRTPSGIEMANGRPLAHKNCPPLLDNLSKELFALAQRRSKRQLLTFGTSKQEKLDRMLFSIASANVGYCSVQPERLSFALLKRLLLSPLLRSCYDLPICATSPFTYTAIH